MKKLSIFMAMAAVALGFTSCEEDKEPVYQVPTTFEVNRPTMEDQYIVLSDEGTLELVCSQPDYGYSAVAKYSAEISLDENFSKFYAVNAVDEHQARMNLKQQEIALGMCELLGIDGEDAFKEMYPDGMPFMTVYFRAVCQLDGVGSSLIKSNIVSYNYIKGYLAVQSPGYIYLVGNPEGWSGPDAANAAHYAPWRLFEPETAIGSLVYSAVFTLPSSPMFRFYTDLTGWDKDSYGCQQDDNPLDFELVDGSFEGAINGPGWKGSYNFPNYTGGTATLTVNMADPSAMTFTMVEGEHEVVVTQYVYMVGNNGGWTEPVEGTYEDWKLADADGSGIYAATFDLSNLEADDLYCRFYQVLTGWGAAQWASPTDADYEVASGQTYPTKAGEGVFWLKGAKGRTVNVVLNTNLNEVTFTFVD